MRFIFTCGGTAGHINPAIAVAQRLKQVIPSCEILFIGAQDKMEMDLVPREGYEIKGIKITNLSRELSVEGLKHNIGTIKNVFNSTRYANEIIKEFAPDVVIGTGGYVCYPVISAAHKLKIPTIIHESNAAPGLTTKLLEKKVNKILVGLENCAHEYSVPYKVVSTGTPVRDEFSMYTKQSARAELGIGSEEKVVLSVWGSLGAGYMNKVVREMIPMIKSGEFRFIHTTGNSYYKNFMEKVKGESPDYEMKGVEIREYLHDMARFMVAADVIICRAGASTLSELTFLGKPALLVPSPNVVNNHQEKNARILEEAGGAAVLTENQINAESFLKKIRELMHNEEKLKAMSNSMYAQSKNDAADRIVNTIFDILNK